MLHQLWQHALGEEQALHHELLDLKEKFTKKLETMLARPVPLRALFKHLREHDPIMVVPGLAVVSKYDDVLEVLKNEASFSVTEIYAAKMERETGDFVLGMGDTPQYHHERDLMQQAVHADDLAHIQKFVVDNSGRARDGGGTVRADRRRRATFPALCRRVWWANTLATPGPDEATQMRWMRDHLPRHFPELGQRCRDAGKGDYRTGQPSTPT